MTSPPTEELSLVPIRQNVLSPIETLKLNKLDSKTPPEEVLARAHEWFSGLSRVERAQRQILFVGSHILLNVSARRLYAPKYKNFEEYLAAEILTKYELKRSTVMNAYSIVKQIPGITYEQFSEGVGQNLLTASKLVKKERKAGTISEAKIQKLVAASAELPISEFESKFLGRAQHVGFQVVRVPCAQKTQMLWEKKFNKRQQEDPEITPETFLLELLAK